MPVGFVGVPESKRRLAASGLAQIRLEGTRGGAGLVAAAVNALLRAACCQLIEHLAGALHHGCGHAGEAGGLDAVAAAGASALHLDGEHQIGAGFLPPSPGSWPRWSARRPDC